MKASIPEIIEGLINAGLSKYKMAKRLGVSWRTLRYWQLGKWEPKAENVKALEALAKEYGI